MNVDTQIQPLAAIASPTRSVHQPAEQVSNRPVERPHHAEASDNPARREITQPEARNEQGRPDKHNRTVRQESELSPEEKHELEKLEARDREVRAHEAAHKNAAGNLARGTAQFNYEYGPDGRRYAVGGEVSIDTSKVAGDPEATIHKAQGIRRAANAPAQPSAQDRAVAAEASHMEAEARLELNTGEAGQSTTKTRQPNSAQSIYKANDVAATSIGTLLDVNA
jgi:hypothetical protein